MKEDVFLFLFAYILVSLSACLLVGLSNLFFFLFLFFVGLFIGLFVKPVAGALQKSPSQEGTGGSSLA